MCGCRWQWTDRPGVGCRPRTERALRDVQPEPYPISPELGQLLVLSRVRRGRVVLVGRDLLIDHGRRVPDYIRAPLRELLDDGQLYLGANGWNGVNGLYLSCPRESSCTRSSKNSASEGCHHAIALAEWR